MYNRRKTKLKRNDISYQSKLQTWNSGEYKRVLRIKNRRKMVRKFCI